MADNVALGGPRFFFVPCPDDDDKNVLWPSGTCFFFSFFGQDRKESVLFVQTQIRSRRFLQNLQSGVAVVLFCHFPPDHRSQCQHAVQHVCLARSARSSLLNSTSHHRLVLVRCFEIKGSRKSVAYTSHASGAMKDATAGRNLESPNSRVEGSWAAELKKSVLEPPSSRDAGLLVKTWEHSLSRSTSRKVNSY